MKKTIKAMVAAAMVLGMGFTATAKTWTNFGGVGITVPVANNVTVKGMETNDFDLNIKNYVGISEMYMGVHENGFAVRAYEESTFLKMNNHVQGFEYTDFGYSFAIGAGYAPIHTEKFTLGVFGMAGLDLTYGSSKEETLNGEKISYAELYMAPTLGANATFTYTPSNRFSLWSSCTANWMVPGLYGRTYLKNGEVDDNLTKAGTTTAGVKVLPSVGCCWKF